ncbi:hypothetical protein H696_05853 [Fonticula alba]|uniref:Ferroxidase n=1 Tax=Fonticula alba TaxID=691883 RepID=A0A058Z0E4_FONAL|nr:hypothetical protein H696_05853 [Fonticula alba]KCV67744.1 hypothetical protein H696_05853 [Fonticula alba]|eukprot:XP_009497928.1 hypothetical protein H696_05853 [Fonticula alba]
MLRLASAAPLLRRAVPMMASRGLSTLGYNNASETTLENLADQLDGLAERLPTMKQLDASRRAESLLDADYSSGVLTLDIKAAPFGGKSGTFVINKQPPNQQIWLSSPLSGPRRYNLDTTRREWVPCPTTAEGVPPGENIESLLSRELTDMLSIGPVPGTGRILIEPADLEDVDL